MIKLDIKINGLDRVKAHLENKRKQVQFAAAVALTKTAKAVEREVYGEFKRVIDRPTPTMMKALRTKTATKADLTAKVFVKDRPLGGKNPNSMADLLAHQFKGGGRIHKALEIALRSNGLLKEGQFVVPGAGAKLDRYGNMSRGQIVQILSQIGVRRMGYDSSPTGSKRSRRNVAAAGRIFWSHGPSGNRGKQLVDKATGIAYGYTSGGAANHLPAGAWVAEGRGVKPLLLVVSGTRYRRRIDMDAIGARVTAKVWPGIFDAELARAMATAR